MRKLFFCTLLAMAGVASAKVTLPTHFTSNMIIQRNTTLPIKGKARPGATVSLTTSWNKKAVTAKADSNGAFAMSVETPKAGGPYTMTFDDGDKTVLDNILSGEVWLGSGQSNMEMPLEGWGKVLNYQEEIAAANYPKIRLLQVKKTTSIKPKDEVELTMDGWQECSPQTVHNFSALCYFYALRLWEETGVPVGVIDDDWGGTPCESWISAEALTGVTGYEALMTKILELGQDEDKVNKYYESVYEEFHNKEKAIDEGFKTGWQNVGTDDSQWQKMSAPERWENVIGGFDGVMWFRRTIDIPQDMAGKALTFSMGRYDDMGMTYWNGKLIGETHAVSDNVQHTVPADIVKSGKNEICIRVTDTGGDGGLITDKNQMYVSSADGKKISLAGEWKFKKGLDLRDLPERPMGINDPHHPSVLYNAMISPLTDFPIRGVIWYQGCNNVGRAQQHEALFQTLITDWRARFHNPDMPFYFVQLANYLTPRDVQPDSEWALLRESQAAALALPNTGMAVNIDLGDANDIHPKTKRELGRRLAAIALNRTYGKKNAYTAPTYESYSVEQGKIRIHLSAPKGVEPLVQESGLKGFTIAGADRKWHVAQAYTEGNDIIVSCPEVNVPLAVRYGWADNPTCTLRTASGLHVAPFRTDKW